MEFRIPEKSKLGPLMMVVMRVMIGWIMLWAFFDKTFGLGYETPSSEGWIDGGSPSSYVEWMASGVFKDVFVSLAGNSFVDAILVLGCLGLGITLIFGFASKITTVLMVIFLIFMYAIVVPPKDNPLIDYHIVFIVAAIVIYCYGGYDKYSLGNWWKNLWFVKKFPILE